VISPLVLPAIPATTATAQTHASLTQLHPLENRKLRIIAHTDLSIETGTENPYRFETTLHFCLSSVPLFSIPLTYRTDTDPTGLPPEQDDTTLPELVDALIAKRAALIAKTLMNDPYALACYLAIFTNYLTLISPQSTQHAKMQGEWHLFQRAMHRLANFQRTTSAFSSVAQKNRALHALLNQITQVFCRSACTPCPLVNTQTIPLSAHCQAKSPTSQTAEAIAYGTNSNPSDESLTISHGEWANGELSLTLAPGATSASNLTWVQHFRVNIFVTNSDYPEGHLVNSQCYSPSLLQQQPINRITLSLTQQWQSIKDVTLQLLAYGDPSVFTRPAICHFGHITEAVIVAPQPSDAPKHAVTHQHTPIPWISHLSTKQLRLKWNIEGNHGYAVTVKEHSGREVVSVWLDNGQAREGLLLSREDFNDLFPHEVWVSVTSVASQQAANTLSAEKASFRPLFVSLPTLTVYRDKPATKATFANTPASHTAATGSESLGCHWDAPNYPVAYYQAELFEIRQGLALPRLQKKLSANCHHLCFDEIIKRSNGQHLYEFRLRAKLANTKGLFTWTPATVVKLQPPDLPTPPTP
jgi:hypothetical protein